MKRIGLAIGFLALLIVVLPPLAAQDGKKDDAKKDGAKKDEPKKDDEKKPEAKKAEKEKLSYSNSFRTKIISVKGENGRDFTIEVQEIDPKKVYDTNVWVAQRQAQLTQDLFNAQRQKGQQYQQAIFNYNKSLATFQFDLEKRKAGNYTAKNVEVTAADNAKVRIMYLTPEFDDAGTIKKLTKKDIEAHKDKTGLPGFPAEFDQIKVGQTVVIYMAKQAAPAKTSAKKKKDDDEEAPAAQAMRKDYVMIVIVAEPMQK